MILKPLLAWPLIVILIICIVAVLGWGLWRTFLRHKPLTRTFWRAFAISLCLLGIAIGVNVPGQKSPAGMVNLDVVFVVDRTASISAEDYNGTSERLEGVKHDISELITAFTGARMALITFDSSARVVVPLTDDASALSVATETLQQERTTQSHGSKIDEPIAVTKKLLEQSKQGNPEKGRLVFYFGDGEQTADTEPTSFASLKSLIDGGGVLGYGTSTGGKMKYHSGYEQVYSDNSDSSGDTYIIDYTQRDANNNNPEAVSKINEGNLQTIATDLGVPYEHRTSPTQSLSAIIKKSNATTVSDAHRQVLHYAGLYWVFAIGIGVLFIWWAIDIVSILGALSPSRQPKHKEKTQ